MYISFTSTKKRNSVLDMAGVRRLSTHEIMRVSREVFDKLSSQHSTFDLPAVQKFFGSARFDLSDEEIKDVELAVLLVASAHKTSDKRFDEARRLLNLCSFLSSYNGNAVQRVVHYFTKAFQERIARETGVMLSDSKARKMVYPIEPTDEVVDPDFVSCCLKLPAIRISYFSAIQVVVDSLASAKKVHFVALSIRNGVHCPVLMQALANRQECPVEFLKITAVAIAETKQKIEEIGKSLTYLAKTLNIPFSFCSIGIADIKDPGKEIFETSGDEAVAVLSLTGLRNIRAMPDCWKSFPGFLRILNPCVLVIVEPEENYDSPIFIDRFHESLLSLSSFYDCIETFVRKEDRKRVWLEAMMGQEIEHVVAAKDEELLYRHTRIDAWRAYFTGFGMVEIEVSLSSFDQANLLLKTSASEESCLLERNGKCLVTGWKGTPFLTVSAWKFQPNGSGGKDI